MKKDLRTILENWPQYFIQDIDLSVLLEKTDDARHSIVKRALKKGLLTRIKRGLYLIVGKTKKSLPDEFELALLIYGPSFVSLESALSYHSWIPEMVYTTTCASIKRAKAFKTPVGTFDYKHVPIKNFYTGVERIKTEKGVIFIATPWRALADFMYTKRKSWKSIAQLEADLRIDKKTIFNSNKEQLILLTKQYPSPRVRKVLKKLANEII